MSQSRDHQETVQNALSDKSRDAAYNSGSDKSKTKSMSRLSRQPGTFIETDSDRAMSGASRQYRLCRPKSQDYSYSVLPDPVTVSRPVSGAPALPPRKPLGQGFRKSFFRPYECANGCI